MSRMAPFTDGGRTDRSHELGEHVHLVLSVRRRDRARAGSDAARAVGRPSHARRLHARDVARARQAGRRARRLRRSVRTRSRRRRSRGSRKSAATRRSRATSSAATSSGREAADYARLLGRAGFVAAQARRRPRVVGRRPHGGAQRRRPHCRDCGELTGGTRRDSTTTIS